ncbi:CsbD family protein [Specibacter cremeus]|uniref:CsbD family protein n=1 Tax=Specibacter cremeus TaxID=1629051 RepID=UPI000F793EEA|nr:CsbD family protein [Specibacter cremeus]
MGLGDKIKNEARKVTGRAKEKTGEATGDKGLEAEGKAEHAKGLEAEGKAEHAKGSLKHAGENIKNVFKKH